MVWNIKKVKDIEFYQKMVVTNIIVDSVNKIVSLLRQFVSLNKVLNNFKLKFLRLSSVPSRQQFMKKLTIPNYVDKALKIQRKYRFNILIKRLKAGEISIKKLIKPVLLKKEIKQVKVDRLTRIQKMIRLKLHWKREYWDRLIDEKISASTAKVDPIPVKRDKAEASVTEPGDSGNKKDIKDFDDEGVSEGAAKEVTMQQSPMASYKKEIAGLIFIGLVIIYFKFFV